MTISDLIDLLFAMPDQNMIVKLDDGLRLRDVFADDMTIKDVDGISNCLVIHV